jgi:hypothetical protein
MVENPGSKDKSLEALDFIINVLREHEQILDKSIDELATVTEQLGNTEVLNGKIVKVEEKISNLQKEVTHLIGCISNAPKGALTAAEKNQEPSAQEVPATPLALVKSGVSVILHCKQWTDFQVLAMHAQLLSFRCKEVEKVFEVDALKEKQLITYTGALPILSSILKGWLSRQFEMSEQSILEGFLDKRK